MSAQQYRTSQDEQQEQDQQETAKVSRGGQKHIVARGETLASISRKTYGMARYWRKIVEANPGRVHRGGDLIVVGDELTLPVLEVPAKTAPAATTSTTPAAPSTATPAAPSTATPAAPSTATPSAAEASAPTTAAVEPRYHISAYGDFIVYPDSFAGVRRQEEGHQTISESELPGKLAALEAAAQVRQAEVEASVTTLLTRSVWSGDVVVTDAEALSALNALGSLQYKERKAACANLGEANIRTMLEEMPESARTSDAWMKVIWVLDAQMVVPHVQSLLSTGWFSSIDAAELREVVQIVGRLDSTMAFAVFQQLDADVQTQMLALLPRGAALTDEQGAMLRALFHGSTNVNDKIRFMSQYFDVVVEKGRLAGDAEDQGVDWTVDGLDSVFWVLDSLPVAHVAGNDEFDKLWRYEARNASDRTSTSGGYYQGGSRDVVALEYQNLNATNSSEAGDPLQGVNRFDKVVRHEIGHAVDDRINATGTICASATGGSWVEHGADYTTVAEAMIAGTNGAVHGLPAAQRAEVKSKVEGWMSTRKKSGYAAALETELSFWGTLDAATQNALKADTVWNALAQAFNAPWYRESGGGTTLGSRIYQESYANEWTSYAASARGNKVSEYQFRAPGEWFAEAYACYYEDGTGQLLEGRDRPTKVWFDANVNNIASATP